MCFHSSVIPRLDQIKKNKITGEFYLTDLVSILHKNKNKISFIEINEEEILGIITKLIYQSPKKSVKILRKKAMLNEKLIDPETVLNFDTKLEKNIIIHPNVVFGKKVQIENLSK